MQTIETVSPSTRPWYKEPWVWFLLAIPLATVIAGLITLQIAATNADPFIERPPEKIGLGQYTPNNSISQSKVTRRRGEDSTGSTASHADTVSFDLELE
jgi:hypothetical protein